MHFREMLTSRLSNKEMKHQKAERRLGIAYNKQLRTSAVPRTGAKDWIGNSSERVWMWLWCGAHLPGVREACFRVYHRGSQVWCCTHMTSALRRKRPEGQKFKVLFGHIRSLTLALDIEESLKIKADQEALEASPVTACVPQSPLASAGPGLSEGKA